MSKATEQFGPPPQEAPAVKGLPKAEIVPPKQVALKPKTQPAKPSASKAKRRKIIDDAIARRQAEATACDEIFIELSEKLAVNSLADHGERERLVAGFKSHIDADDFQFLLDCGFDVEHIQRGILQAANFARLRVVAGSKEDLAIAFAEREAAENRLETETPKIQKQIVLLQNQIDALKSEVAPKIEKHEGMVNARVRLLHASPDNAKRKHEAAKREQLQAIDDRIRQAKNELNILGSRVSFDEQKLWQLPKNHLIFKFVRNQNEQGNSLPSMAEYRLQNAPILEELRQNMKSLVAERDAEADKIDSLFQDF